MDEKHHELHEERVEHPNMTLDELKPTATIDTLHNDEALKVLARYGGDQEWSEKEEKKLRHKIDRRLLSILCITYGLQYYDKAMLGQAVRYG
jgi:hypothetical protein